MAIIMHPAVIAVIPGDLVPVSLRLRLITTAIENTMHAKKAYGIATFQSMS